MVKGVAGYPKPGLRAFGEVLILSFRALRDARFLVPLGGRVWPSEAVSEGVWRGVVGGLFRMVTRR